MTPLMLRVTMLSLAFFAASCSNPAPIPPAPAATPPPPTATTPYGANPSASGTFTHDGVKLYFETYGTGEPLFLVHGNGMSIGSMAAQIDFFKSHRKVIAMDSRDH